MPVKCDGYRILIREMLQGRLDLDEATVVAAHMDACEFCRSFYREMVAESRGGEDHSTGTAGKPENPSVAQSSVGVFPVVIAVILGVLILTGLIFTARYAGWFRSGRSSGNDSGHHSGIHRRSH